jgi:hypothetical protein
MLFRKTGELKIDFCDSCARICDRACRAEELRERTLVSALRLGVRV